MNYHEADSVAAGYKAIADKADEIDAKLPAAMRPSFYELVKFPVQICANLNELYYAAAQNALYASQGRASAGDKAAEVRALFAKDGEMTTYYNKTFLDGKWDHFMDQTHIGYTSWQDPGQNNLNTIGLAETRAQAAAAVANAPAGPARRGGGGGGFGAPGGRGGRGGGGNRVLEDPPEASVMGVAVEGNEAAFSGGKASAPALPAFDAFNQQRRYVDVFDKGRTAFSFSATASAPWIVLSRRRAAWTKTSASGSAWIGQGARGRRPRSRHHNRSNQHRHCGCFRIESDSNHADDSLRVRRGRRRSRH